RRIAARRTSTSGRRRTPHAASSTRRSSSGSPASTGSGRPCRSSRCWRWWTTAEHSGNGLRSERWFGGRDLAGVIHRASIHAEGISRAALAGRPVIGICNPWSELVNCNLHFRGLAEAVRRGVLLAGGLPLEFPTISLGENLMKPTTLLYRNLM